MNTSLGEAFLVMGLFCLYAFAIAATFAWCFVLPVIGLLYVAGYIH